MNWLVFTAAAWVLLGLELGLRDLLRLGTSNIAPSFVLAFLAYIAMYAPPATVTFASLILGVAIDLSWPRELRDGQTLTVVGPYALGCLLGGQLVITMRGLMMRRNPLTLAFLATLAALVTQVIVVAFHTLRAIFWNEGPWSASGELVERFASSLYTGVLALVLSLLLLPLAPLIGFETVQTRRFARRS